MEIPSIKEGNRKEIKCLHDVHVLLQDYRAIKVMDQDNFGETLLTAFIKLKLDPNHHERTFQPGTQRSATI